jgi:hypothetical protein
MNEPVDKRFLLVTLLFGILAGGVCASWLNEGQIAIRYGRAHGQPAPRNPGPPAGLITKDQLLFYPVCTAWGALGLTMVVSSGLAFLHNSHTWAKTGAYCCAILLLLTFLTVAVAILWKPA